MHAFRRGYHHSTREVADGNGGGDGIGGGADHRDRAFVLDSDVGAGAVGGDRNRVREVANGDGRGDSVGRTVDHRDGVTATVENVDAAAVGGSRHPVRGAADGDGCDNTERHGLPSGRILSPKIWPTGAKTTTARGAQRSYRETVPTASLKRSSFESPSIEKLPPCRTPPNACEIRQITETGQGRRPKNQNRWVAAQ